MNLENVVKTLFSTYRYLDKMTKVVDRYVKAKSMSCLGASINNAISTSTLFVADSLTYLVNNKISLINFKIITNVLLKNMSERNSVLIILKYVDGMKNEELAEHFNVCERTIFRWHEKAISNAVDVFQEENFNNEKVLSNFDNVSWVKSVYQDYEMQTNCENIKYSEVHIFKKAFSEYRKVMAI